jgi:hypothetical protein
MAENKDQILDKLSRAFEMEESMGSKLLELCDLKESIPGLAESARQQIQEALNKIQADTIRHKKAIMEILNTLYDSNRG